MYFSMKIIPCLCTEWRRFRSAAVSKSFDCQASNIQNNSIMRQNWNALKLIKLREASCRVGEWNSRHVLFCFNLFPRCLVVYIYYYGISNRRSEIKWRVKTRIGQRVNQGLQLRRTCLPVEAMELWLHWWKRFFYRGEHHILRVRGRICAVWVWQRAEHASSAFCSP